MSPMLRISGVVLVALTFSASAPGQLINFAVWPVTNGGNGRLYQAWLVPSGPISWTAARTFAQGLMPGVSDLATPTTGAENDFVFGLCSGFPSLWVPSTSGTGAIGPWIGASKISGAWTWISGEPWCYTNWGLGEPNDNCMSGEGTENHVHYSGPVAYPLGSIMNYWNDLPGAGCTPAGMFPQSFVVEYTSFDMTITQSAGPVPPAGIYLSAGVGPPGSLFFNPILVTPVGGGDPCLNGWFFGINPTIVGLLSLYGSGPPFLGALPPSGTFSLYLPTAGIGALQLNYVGVLISSGTGAIVAAGIPKSLITF